MSTLAQSRPSEKRAVLITGCSSGIGRATALHLARHGFTVFAGVRKDRDAESLRGEGIQTLLPLCPLDLTVPEHIQAAGGSVRAELARCGIQGLYAIVSNAGGGGIMPIELMDPEALKAELTARLVGPVALLQTFLPDIRAAHGRIVWIATPGMFPVKYVAGIHAPDFAVNCLARTLNLELKPWNIPSILVRCGAIQTPAAARGHQELSENLERWPAERLALYREALVKENAELGRMDAQRTDPEVVARVVERALNAAHPHGRYQVGHLAGVSAALELLPQAVVDAIMALRG